MLGVSELLKEKLKEVILKIEKIEVDSFVLEHPENETHGDYATNVALILGRKLNKNPWIVAQEIVGELQNVNLNFESAGSHYPIFHTIEAVKPGFVNFKFSNEYLKQEIGNILVEKDKYGSSDIGKGKNILIEYSNPNPNKPLHIGHTRNNFLGSSLSEIYKFCGYEITKMNYMNNWGTHICMSMLMYKKYGENKNPDKKPDHFVGEFYAMYEREHERTPEVLEKELAEMFQKLESEDPETKALWEKITNWVYEGWETTYKQENVSFDTNIYQSEYTKAGKEIVDLAVKKGIAVKDPSGAVIAKLEQYGLPDKVLLRSDGTSIYITQDTQLAKDNYEKYKFDKRIYVVDIRQSDYFKQLFKVLELLGFEWVSRLHHLAYGWVSLPEGAMSSRTGNVVNADDVFDRLVKLEKDEIRSSSKKVQNLDETAEKLALAALRYGILKIDPKQDIVFDYSKVTKFEGNTGPYLMYTYARANSILEKSAAGDRTNDYSLKMYESVDLTDSENALLRSLYRFPEVVLSSAMGFSPHDIANYLYDLAQRFNSFYANTPVLNSSEELRGFRECLVKSVSQVMKSGLSLLGVNVVEKM